MTNVEELQRIFQQPFFWKAIGVDIRGRSRTLKVNYRTSHQIRILEAGRLRFAGTDVYPVITGGSPTTVEVIVRPVR